MNFDNTNIEGTKFLSDVFIADTWRVESGEDQDLLPKDGEKVVDYIKKIHNKRGAHAIHEQCPKGSRGLQVVLTKFPHGNFEVLVGLSQPIIAMRGCRNPGYKGEKFSVDIEITGGWYETFTEIEKRRETHRKKIDARTALAIRAYKEKPDKFKIFLEPLERFQKNFQMYSLGLLLETKEKYYYINLENGFVVFSDDLAHLRRNAEFQRAIIGKVAQFQS